MKITVLTDDKKSWFVPYGRKLAAALRKAGHRVKYVHESVKVGKGDVCFMLSCVKLVKEDVLGRNTNNIVVHASDLPQGKGFSPLQRQVIEGRDEITLTLFEAVKNVDAGPYYLKSRLKLDGTELLDELRKKMAGRIMEMCIEYVAGRQGLKPVPQSGTESYYERMTEADDEVSPDAAIRDIFNRLRAADNEKYPVFFRLKGKKFFIKVYPGDGVPEKGNKEGGQ